LLLLLFTGNILMGPSLRWWGRISNSGAQTPELAGYGTDHVMKNN